MYIPRGSNVVPFFGSLEISGFNYLFLVVPILEVLKPSLEEVLLLEVHRLFITVKVESRYRFRLEILGFRAE